MFPLLDCIKSGEVERTLFFYAAVLAGLSNLVNIKRGTDGIEKVNF